MLSLPGFDASRLAGLRVRIQDMAVRQNRYRREAQSIGVPADCPETHRLVEVAEQDTAAPAADARSPSAQGLIARALAALRGAPSRNGEPA